MIERADVVQMFTDLSIKGFSIRRYTFGDMYAFSDLALPKDGERVNGGRGFKNQSNTKKANHT